MSRGPDPRLVRTVPALRRLVAALAVLQLLVAGAVVVQAVQLATVLSAVVLQGRSGGSLVRPLVLLAAAGLIRATSSGLQEWLASRASATSRYELRQRTVEAVVRLGPVWAAQQPKGRLATATGPGLEALDGYVARAVPAMVSAAVVPAVALAGIALADWRSALILVAVLPLVPLFMALVGISTGRQMQRRYAALSRLSGHFLDLVTGLTTLKVYGQAGRQVDTVRAATHAYRRQTLQTLRLAFLSGLVLDLIATLSVAVVAVSIGLRLDHGHVSLHVALLTLLLAPEVFAPLRAVGAQHHAAEEGRVAAAAALDILDACPGVEASTFAEPLRSNGSVSLRGVTVCYPGRREPALHDLSVELRCGELVAVQGTSGGGKSTLLATLLGLVAPAAGTVRLGEVDQEALAPADWRSALAWVPQRPHPTQTDVGAEVSLGDPLAPASAVLAAIADCHAPHPSTPLGEDGLAISAGQRRRVALARALLRARSVRDEGGVPLVLLDEPSEDLDHETEQVVASVIAGLSGWATVVMVTHSVRLASTAARLLQIEDGRLVRDSRCRPVAVPPVPPQRPALPAVPHRSAAGPAASWRPLLSGLPGAGRRLAGAAALSGAAGLAGLALTATSVWLICRAAQHPNLQALALAVVGVRTFALAKALLRYAERMVSHDVALRLLAELRARVFASLEPLAPAGLVEFRRGDLLRRFVADVDGVQEGLVRAVVPLAGAVLTCLAAVAIAAALSLSTAVALACGLTVSLVAAPALTMWAAGDARELTAAASLRDERITALLDGLAELTAYGRTEAATEVIDAAGRRARSAARRPGLAAGTGVVVSGAAAALTLPAVVWLSAAAVHRGLTAVAAGALVALALTGFDAMAGVPAAVAAASRLRRGLDRVSALLSTPPPMPGSGCVVRPPHGATSLTLLDVTVAPAPSAAAVVTGAALHVRAGTRVAVTGPSGCGKSTLLKAVLRLLPVEGGDVVLAAGGDRSTLAALSPQQVPPLVAGSLQGDHVFDVSLRDNLLVVRPDATQQQLDDAAARAGLSGLVRSLPQGWATPAGADGASLSGGQRQRLLLARAFLADPAVLVLDEPTAHLDQATERAVLADLLDGTRGATVLMTTHRALPDGSVDAVLHLGRATAALDDDCVVPR